MNKKILILSLLVPFWAFSQKVVPSHLDAKIDAKPVEISSKNDLAVEKPYDSIAKVFAPAKNNNQQNNKRHLAYNFVELGSSYYDLQTNASMGRRIHVLPDGKISAVWTTAEDLAFLNRGTGYNSFNGTSWFPATTTPTPRIESTRLGWPSIGLNGSFEWTMAHSAADGGFVFSKNANVGSKTFTSNPLVLSQPQKRPIWGRFMNNVNIFHGIASYSDSSAAGDPRAPSINGVYAPMVYARSTNGATSWEINGSITNGGTLYTNGTYNNIVIRNSGTKKNGLADFTVVNGEITSFTTQGNQADYKLNDLVTLYGNTMNLRSTVNRHVDTIKHTKTTNPLVKGSKVTGRNRHGFYFNCLVNTVINDTMFTVTNTPLYGALTSGSGYTNGNYNNIQLISNINNSINYLANIRVVSNAVTSITITNASDVVDNLNLTLTPEYEVNADLDMNSDTILFDNPLMNLIKGSIIKSKNNATIASNCVINEVLNDSTVVVSSNPLISGDDTIVITPPYGNGTAFEYAINNSLKTDTLNIEVPYGNGRSFEYLYSNYRTMPGYNSKRITSGGGDNYSIDVRDSIVAIVTGRSLSDIFLFKSTDNGLTFTTTIIDSFMYAPYTSKKLMLDTPYVCDGSLDVLIDNDGKVHAFWGVTRVLDTDTTDELYSFYPATSLLGYWNEVSNTSTFIAGGGQLDRDNNGTLDISAGNTAALDQGRVPATLKTNGISGVARLGNTALLRMPSAGIDASGNIFVSFSFPLEGDRDVNNLNLRDIFLVHSTDGGNTWSAPQDITQKQGQEEDFASVARVVNDFVHVVFQMDDLAGTNLQNNDAQDNNHPVSANKIMYVAVPKAKILDGSIGNIWATDVKDVKSNKEVFIVSQNQPNPFNMYSEVVIWLDDETNVDIEITNISGQVVRTIKYGQLGMGNHSLQMDGTGLTSGIYFYTVKTPTHSVTKKMSIF